MMKHLNLNYLFKLLNYITGIQFSLQVIGVQLFIKIAKLYYLLI